MLVMFHMASGLSASFLDTAVLGVSRFGVFVRKPLRSRQYTMRRGSSTCWL